MKIRQATLDDLKQIQDLNHQLFIHDFAFDDLLNLEWPYQEKGEKFFRISITSNNRCCYVAENDEKIIIGYLTGFIEDISGWRKVRRAELSNMLVSKKYRGNGVGKQLAEAFFDWGKQQKVEKFFVSAYAPNKNAIAFYKSIGFTSYEIGLEKDNK